MQLVCPSCAATTHVEAHALATARCHKCGAALPPVRAEGDELFPDLGAESSGRFAAPPADSEHAPPQGPDPFANLELDLGASAPAPLAAAAEPAPASADPFADLNFEGLPAAAAPAPVEAATAPLAAPTEPAPASADPFADLNFEGLPAAAAPAPSADPFADMSFDGIPATVTPPAPAGTHGAPEPGRDAPHAPLDDPPRTPIASQLASGVVVLGREAPLRRGPRVPRRILVSVIGIAACGLAVAGYLLSKEPPTAAAYRSQLAVWALALPELAGTSEAHEARGRALLAEDSPASLLGAMDAFRRAVLLDPDNLVAAAGYVETLGIFGRDPGSGKAFDEARGIVRHVLALRPEAPEGHRAAAQLLLVDDQAEVRQLAREHAERALAIAPNDPYALLALGRSYLSTNGVLAGEYFDRAITAQPGFKRAYLYRGLSREKVGDLAGAIANFERRLEVDADDELALREIARVSVRVGDFARARSLYERLLELLPEDPGARLGLAVLEYQHEGKAARARTRLEALLSDEEVLEERLLARVLTHAAALEREQGALEAARALLDRTAGLGENARVALVQRILLAIASDDSKAALALLETGGEVIDPVEGAILRVRALLRGADVALTRQALEEAAKLAPYRREPYLYAAIFHARAERLQPMAVAVRRLSELEPEAPLAPMLAPEAYESPRAKLRGAEQVFLRLAQPQLERAPAYAGAALVFAMRGEYEAAREQSNAALALDPDSLPALVAGTVAALATSELATAERFAARVRRAEKVIPIGYLLHGLVLERRGASKDARAAFTRALDLDAAYLPASERLAALLARQGEVDEAEERFLEVLATDVSNARARTGLFHLRRARGGGTK